MTKDQLSDESSLHLMVQTPTSLFVYWKLTQEYLDLAQSAIQEIFPGIWLRLMKEGKNGPEAVENQFISGFPANGSLYFISQRPYSMYFAELALDYHGNFFVLLRSGPALLPPDSKAEQKLDTTVTWPVIIPPFLPFAYSPTEYQDERGK